MGGQRVLMEDGIADYKYVPPLQNIKPLSLRKLYHKSVALAHVEWFK